MDITSEQNKQKKITLANAQNKNDEKSNAISRKILIVGWVI